MGSDAAYFCFPLAFVPAETLFYCLLCFPLRGAFSRLSPGGWPARLSGCAAKPRPSGRAPPGTRFWPEGSTLWTPFWLWLIEWMAFSVRPDCMGRFICARDRLR